MKSELKIQRLDVLQDISPEQWALHCPSLEIVKLSDRMRIYQQGEQCRHVFCIHEGHVKLTRVNNEGGQLITAILTPGEIFGPTLTGAHTAADESALAKGELQLYRISAEDFRSLMNSQPALGWKVIEMLGRRQRFLELRLECLLSQDVRARIAGVLYQMARDSGEKCQHGLEVDVRLTHQELAELVGAGRPTVSTILSELREQGIVAYGRDFICISRLEDLKRIFE